MQRQRFFLHDAIENSQITDLPSSSTDYYQHNFFKGSPSIIRNQSINHCAAGQGTTGKEQWSRLELFGKTHYR